MATGVMVLSFDAKRPFRPPTHSLETSLSGRKEKHTHTHTHPHTHIHTTGACVCASMDTQTEITHFIHQCGDSFVKLNGERLGDRWSDGQGDILSGHRAIKEMQNLAHFWDKQTVLVDMMG